MSIHRFSKETREQQVNSGTVVRGVKLQASYSKLALSQKLIMPFLLVFFSIMVLLVISSAYVFSSSMQQQMTNDLEMKASIILQELHQEKKNLNSWAKLLAEREDVRTAVKQADTQKLIQILVSQKTTLELDLLKIVNQNGAVLLNMTQPALGESTIEDKNSISLALSGMYPSDVVNILKKEGQTQSVIVGIAPIQFQEEVIGAIELGTVIKPKLFQYLDTPNGEHATAFHSDQSAVLCVYASTLPVACNTNWQIPLVSEPPQRLIIAGEDYLAKASLISGVNNTSLIVVLLKSLSPLNKTLQFMWLRLWGFFVLGAFIVIVIGRNIVRGIAGPILALARIAQKVTKESNFDLQAPVTTNDEVGMLATSLNSLIRRVAEYTQQLELARQTLERRVQERTQQLLQKNQELNQAYDQLSQALTELQQTQAQLIQTEKMSSLGNMVAGVAHEINNPINFIYGNISHAKEYTQELLKLLFLYQKEYPQPTAPINYQLKEIDFDFISEDLPKLMTSMKMGAQRIRDIVLSLRSFSRLDEADMKMVDIHEGIDSALLILNHRMKDTIQIIKEYGNLPQIECYPAQLNQAFMNILNNAIDAVQQRWKNLPIQNPVIRIRTTIATIDTSANSEPSVCIQFVDNGSGIEPKLQDKIFDPFFTTKEVGKGTGLGLWICYQIMQKHRGNIKVNSVLGEGTTVTLTLPLSQSGKA
ncbi:MAG: ATP-binding protein [Scytonema sp. PMC 1069.18]|nr:ATP-binding protein [Scytonema sp. PMC 1069.18]MEC4884174.1 ATP-binding protein [Scytonema sp. PMC 1070.18]